MSYHPNFPPSLSISPTAGPGTRIYVLGGVCRDAFGPEAQHEAISRYGIAGRIWESAYTLCAYINSAKELDFDPPFVDNLRVPLGAIELGSGTGMVTANIANFIQNTDLSSGSFVIATDLPDVCPLLEHNLETDVLKEFSAHCTLVFVRPLAWGNLDHATSIVDEFGFHRDPSAAPRGRLTHIICSDLASIFVYFSELFGPLLRTLIHLTSPPSVGSSGPYVKIAISYKIRSLPKETLFWTAFGLWFSFRPVMMHCRENENGFLEDGSDNSGCWRQIGEGDTDRTFVFVAYRRPESIAWKVPESDQELMDGVGARDTTTKKGDDTFETILFMAMGMDSTNE